jgi:hypothetical protein
LGALSGAVDAFNDYQSARISAFGGGLLGRGRISGSRDVRSADDHMK